VVRPWNKNECKKMAWEGGIRSRSDPSVTRRRVPEHRPFLWADWSWGRSVGGKGVTSGESWGVACRLCQAGSHWHNWKSDSGAWMSGGRQAHRPGSAAAGAARGNGWKQAVVVPVPKPKVTTVTPRGVGTVGQGRVTTLRLGAACSGCGPAKGDSPAGYFSFSQQLPANT